MPEGLTLPPMPKLSGAGGPPGGSPGGPGQAPAVGGAGSGGPMPSPMSTPQPMPGVEKGARVQVQVASQMLQRELPNFPLESDEFKALSNALSAIQKAFGKNEDEDRRVFPAEIMNMLSAIGPGSKTPGQQAMAGAPMGGPPPGAGGPPPGAGAPSPLG